MNDRQTDREEVLIWPRLMRKAQWFSSLSYEADKKNSSFCLPKRRKCRGSEIHLVAGYRFIELWGVK